MDLEEQEGVEPLSERCQSCGTRLTATELEAALEGEADVFLCSRCAVEQVPVGEDFSEQA